MLSALYLYTLILNSSLVACMKPVFFRDSLCFLVQSDRNTGFWLWYHFLSRLINVLGSSEELEDLKKAYLNSKGSMEQIINSVMCASYEDESRFRETLLPLIESKELPAYTRFTNESSSSKNKRLSKVCYCVIHPYMRCLECLATYLPTVSYCTVYHRVISRWFPLHHGLQSTTPYLLWE